MPPLYLLLTGIGALLVIILLVTLTVSIVRLARAKRSGIDARNTVLTPTVQPSLPEDAGKSASIVRTVVAVVLLIGVLLYSGWQIFLYVQGSNQTHTVAVTATSTPALQATGTTASSPTPTPTRAPLPPVARPTFQRGMVFPQWSTDAYANDNADWQHGLVAIQQQTAARWIEMPALFSQATPSSTDVVADGAAPSVPSFLQGARAAHAMGYHVFFTALLGVKSPSGSWAADVELDTYQAQQQWFASYWTALKPYIQAAAQEKVEQISIGTEIEWMQQNAAPDLWNTLIAQVRSIFSGTIIYDMNWSSLYLTLPSWMENKNLNMIGVSTYVPLASSPDEVDPASIPALWKEKIGTYLDAVAHQLGKKVLITEIGYRDTVDTLYNPWSQVAGSATVDTAYQAAACNAALSNVMTDPNVDGIFFWGWDNVGALKLANQPATKVLYKWYTAQKL
jgi:hypothetical protein